MIYGLDVSSNAFAEAPPPKQGFYISPDQAFTAWWTIHKGRPPIPANHVIPILSAMQGHPEAPCLWEKHADWILHTIGLAPTTQEPCLYSGVIGGQRVLLLQQVDNFAVATSTESLASRVFDLIDDHLTIPLNVLVLLPSSMAWILSNLGIILRFHAGVTLSASVKSTWMDGGFLSTIWQLDQRHSHRQTPSLNHFLYLQLVMPQSRHRPSSAHPWVLSTQMFLVN